MRVVSGSAKGRHLKSPRSSATRPVMDRVKTALFDILHGAVADSRFLDLFAGTGSVGIEALSRGAAAATFVELSLEALTIVRQNLSITGLAPRAETIHADAFRFLERAHAAGERYDLVYVAPPQYGGLAARAVAQLDAAPLTGPGNLVIVQVHPIERRDFTSLPLHMLHQTDERRYGSTALLFFEHGQDDSSHASALEA